MSTYKAGRLLDFYDNWKKLTSNFHILDIIKNGLSLDFNEVPLEQRAIFCPLSENDKIVIDVELVKLLAKQVITISKHEPVQFISPIFTRLKKDGSRRMILNLKKLNQSMEYQHFKMESTKNVVDVIQPGCYMASVDLKDAVFTIPINKNHKKFFF